VVRLERVAPGEREAPRAAAGWAARKSAREVMAPEVMASEVMPREVMAPEVMAPGAMAEEVAECASTNRPGVNT